MSEKLYWKFDVSTFKLLGRDLITDRITAVYELVKNCYDANAKKVTIEFHDVETRNYKSTIIIRDDGIGMSINDIKDKWLVVGTSNKRKDSFSPAPFFRRYIGEKGVGRFAVDKLGGHLLIRTKRKNDSKILNVVINWGEYDKQMNSSQMTLFTEMANEYYYTDSEGLVQGTELVITNLHETWDTEGTQRLYNQLGRILSPIHELNPPFRIAIDAPVANYENRLILPEPLEKFSTIDVEIPFNSETGKQGSLKFNKKTEDFEVEWISMQSFGLISMRLYYFDQDAQKAFVNYYRNTKNYIEGVKIYRDGVICTPFAEYESNVDKRRDILGIDKRRYQEAFDKLSTRQVIGIVNITKDDNPAIKDATNRQDFVDNIEYRELKDFIIKQLDVLALYRLSHRSEKKAKIQNNLKKATADVKDIAAEVRKIVRSNPSMKIAFQSVLEKSDRLVQVVQEGIKDKEETEKEFLRKENIYLSLMSLQDYATNLAHAIRLLLGKVKRASEYFKNRYPNPALEHRFKQYSILIFEEMQRMSKVVDFMLSYAQSDIDDTEFTVESLLEDMLLSAYQPEFEIENIKVEIEGKVKLSLKANRKYIEDVISNLISNSIKALQNTTSKKVSCKSFIEKEILCIIFSDNGTGIRSGDEDKVFDIYYTTTAEQGGAGLGLFVAKTRMNALNGDIEVIPSIYAPNGATFKITLPLKQFAQ